jgi:large subunit ribosomal protein L14e
MFSVGRICVKIAGRDAGEKCVVVEVIDNNYVLIDGMTRRRKCNKLHLEPTSQTLEIKDKASHDIVAKAFKELGLEIKVTKPKSKTTKPKHVVKSSLKEKPKTPKKEKKAKVVKAEKAKKE